jgi:hypothetical protein
MVRAIGRATSCIAEVPRGISAAVPQNGSYDRSFALARASMPPTRLLRHAVAADGGESRVVHRERHRRVQYVDSFVSPINNPFYRVRGLKESDSGSFLLLYGFPPSLSSGIAPS